MAFVSFAFLGPLSIKKEPQEAEKAYVCLLTWRTTRVVHLELARGMSIGFDKDDVEKRQD